MNAEKLTYTDVKQMAPVGDIKENRRKASVGFLNTLLANEYALFTKTLSYHWNVQGPRFHSMHKLFESHYKKLLTIMDEVAERVRILGDTPLSSVKEMNRRLTIPEGPTIANDTTGMITDLLRDHMYIQTIIKDVLDGDSLDRKDFGSEDLLIEILKEHEMFCWTLQSHLH